ncbi:Lrp/AsnC family transcriptional regulator [Rhodophyticola sp. CCM32]|uniref:Lrp/AsnC family transcriptional regulator n=1 Tax=Rhodophyticola sp. CCM32 TaxID=2916397 RepID=UPI00143D2E84|nr:Lrp/AsnC family transcriptional regulator [Rhodophyticola sp. CCM32]
MLRKRDKIDRELIALLTDQARLSTSEIARRLGLARSTVNERIARLEKDQIILGYHAIVTPDHEVQETRSFLHLRCEHARSRQIVQALRGFPEIRECVSISGPYDLVCTIHTPCTEDIDALIEDLAAIPGILALDATVVLADKFDRLPQRGCGELEHLSLAS